MDKIISNLERNSVRRIIFFSLIVMFSVLSIFWIIKDPDFIETALQYKPIEIEEAKTSLKSTINFNEKNRQKIRSLEDDISILQSYLSKDTEPSALISSLFNNGYLYFIGVNYLNNPDENHKHQFKLELIYESLANYDDHLVKHYVIKTNNEDAYREFAKFSNKTNIKNIEIYRDNFPLLFQLAVENIKNDDSLSNTIKLLNQNFSQDISKLSESIEAFKSNIQSNEVKVNEILLRGKSDQYIFSSALLQRVLFTTLIITIAFYFLKLIGKEVLFIKKVGMVKLSYRISAENQNAELASKIYDNLISDEDEVSVPSTDVSSVLNKLVEKSKKLEKAD